MAAPKKRRDSGFSNIADDLGFFSSLFHQARFLMVHGTYMMFNFTPIFFLMAIYYSTTSYVAAFFCLLVIVDLAVPLHFPNLSDLWCQVTDVCKGKAKYLEAEVWNDCVIEKDQQYMLCAHPHALYLFGYDIMCWDMFQNYGNRVHLLGADVLMKIPLLRRILSWWGVIPADRKSLTTALQRPYPNNVVAIVVGGIAEMFYGTGEHEQIVAVKRKGHIKIALQTGANIIPCYNFGNNQVVHRPFDRNSAMAGFSSKYRVSLGIWFDRFYVPFGLIPRPTKCVMACGEAIKVEKVENPTQEQIDELHAKYLQGMTDIFDKYKHRMGDDWKEKKLYFETDLLPGEEAKKEK